MSLLKDYDVGSWLERAGLEEIKLHVASEKVLCQAIEGMHFHQEHEIFIQLKGKSRFSFPKEERILDEGEVLLIPYGVPHAEVGGSEEPMSNLVLLPSQPYWICHMGSAQLGKHPTVSQIRSYRLHQNELGMRQLDLLVEARRNSSHKALLNGLAYSFFKFLDHAKAVKPKQKMAHQGVSPLVDQCMDLVMGTFNQPECNVQYLAKSLGCSPSHLSRTFSSVTGKGLHRTIVEQRMNQAKRNLREGRFNVSQTAFSCGFDDVSHFVSTFRKEYGITPKKFYLENRVS